MTFQSSWRLVLLLAPLALLVSYLLVQRRRHAEVVRFTSLDLLDSVAPKRSGWQRHVPAASMLLALVVLVLAFAQPAMALRTPRDSATIMLTLDTSASMSSTDVSPNRLAAAEAQAQSFVKHLPKGLQVGLVTFDGSARLVVPPTKDKAQLLDALGSLTVGRGTATADGIRTALTAISSAPKSSSGKPTPAVIVLMSDGTPTIGVDGMSPKDSADAAAAEAKAASVPIDTIAFGTSGGSVNVQGQDVPVPYDPAAMARIAAESSGKTFSASTSGQLGSIYHQIGREVGYVVHTRELTAAFAGLALFVALLGAAASLVWTQRIA
jgi:Ca-activated chloride channel family protein